MSLSRLEWSQKAGHSFWRDDLKILSIVMLTASQSSRMASNAISYQREWDSSKIVQIPNWIDLKYFDQGSYS